MIKKHQIALYVWLALAVAYLVLNLLMPADKPTLRTYHLTAGGLRFLDATILLPVIIIWLLAFIGYISLARYSGAIARSADGRAFMRITLGVMVFAFGLPAAAVISTALKWVVHYHQGFIPSSTIITNYLSLAVAVGAFFLIGDGIYKLLALTRVQVKINYIRLVIISLAIVAASYTFLTFHQPKAVLHAAASHPNLYFLPNWLILFTIVIPYIFMWAIGFIGILHISLYRHKVKGILYRQALSTFTIGLSVVLFSYVIVEYITSLTNKLLQLKLGWLLVIIYIFLVLLGVGYYLIALGAMRLRKIEDA